MRSRIGVYPRVGGETGPAMPSTPGGRGLSPRGRGNLWFLVRTPGKERSIPAWAGKPWWRGCRRRAERVYPRVGGETWKMAKVPWVGGGLSPRGRGNPTIVGRPCGSVGSIPAWAGKPAAAEAWQVMQEVYPRVGGETVPVAAHVLECSGLSPRGRGNPPPA